MALRALNSVVAANYSKLSTDPILAGDLVAYSTADVTHEASSGGGTRSVVSTTASTQASGDGPLRLRPRPVHGRYLPTGIHQRTWEECQRPGSDS
jgi:hypothetical protein